MSQQEAKVVILLRALRLALEQVGQMRQRGAQLCIRRGIQKAEMRLDLLAIEHGGDVVQGAVEQPPAELRLETAAAGEGPGMAAHGRQQHARPQQALFAMAQLGQLGLVLRHIIGQHLRQRVKRLRTR